MSMLVNVCQSMQYSLCLFVLPFQMFSMTKIKLEFKEIRTFVLIVKVNISGVHFVPCCDGKYLKEYPKILISIRQVIVI